MSVVRWQQRKSRLSALINQTGGLSVGAAVTQARANLDVLSARSREIVSERIAALIAMPAPSPGDPNAAALRLQAYELAGAVIDAAGPFELDDLCTAAAGLCDLIDAAPEGEPFDWRIVTVHTQAMQLLLSLPAHEHQARALVLENLKLVLKKKIPLFLDEA